MNLKRTFVLVIIVITHLIAFVNSVNADMMVAGTVVDHLNRAVSEASVYAKHSDASEGRRNETDFLGGFAFEIPDGTNQTGSVGFEDAPQRAGFCDFQKMGSIVTLSFQLTNADIAAGVKIKLMNILGQDLSQYISPIESKKQTGSLTFDFKAAGFASGTYFFYLQKSKGAEIFRVTYAQNRIAGERYFTITHDKIQKKEFLPLGELDLTKESTPEAGLTKTTEVQIWLQVERTGYDPIYQNFSPESLDQLTADTVRVNLIPVQLGAPDSGAISNGYDMLPHVDDDRNGQWYIYGNGIEGKIVLDVSKEHVNVVAVNPNETLDKTVTVAYVDGTHRVEWNNLRFTNTGDPGDVTPPQISGLTYNGTTIDQNATLNNTTLKPEFNITFNEAVTINPDSVKIYTELGDLVACQTTVNGSSVSVKPTSNLEYHGNYYLGVGGVADLAGNKFSGLSFDFTTESEPVQMVRYGGRVWDTDSLLTKTAPADLDLWVKWFNGGQGNRVEGSKQGNIHNFLFEVLQETHIDSVQFGFENFNGTPASFIRTIYSAPNGGNQSMDIAVKTYRGLGDVSPQGYSIGNLEANFDRRGGGAKPLEQGMVWYLVKNCPNPSAVPFTDQQWHDLLDHIDRINSYRAEPLQVIADSSANGFYPTTEAEAEGKIIVYGSLTNGAGSIGYQVRNNSKYFVDIAIFDPTSLDHAVEEEGVNALTSMGFTKTPLLWNSAEGKGKMLIYEGNFLSRAPPADKSNVLFWEAVEKKLGGLSDGMSHGSVLRVQY